jgi:hypothetical protein
MHENVHLMIPELGQWDDKRIITPWAWMGIIGRFDHAIGYSAIFWPDFVLVDDCIFVEAPSAELYERWMSQQNRNRMEVEAVINHRHIVELFPRSGFVPARDVIAHLGVLLKDMWSCKLVRDFPGRHVTVNVYGSESADLVDHQITVFQEAH